VAQASNGESLLFATKGAKKAGEGAKIAGIADIARNRRDRKTRKSHHGVTETRRRANVGKAKIPTGLERSDRDLSPSLRD
jgi:hypothetical protein